MVRLHRSLVMLSREHHQGLLLALRLVQGDKALLGDGWTHDRRGQAVYVAHFFEHDLKRHFRAEEEVLFPSVRAHIAGCVPLIESLIEQHREVEAIVTKLAAADPGQLETFLVSLGRLLESHIRLEERQLFPLYEARIPYDVARIIERKIGEVL